MTADPFSTPLAPGFDDPLGMLVACHRRIERELITLGRLQRHLPEHGCDDDARAAARAVLKYFDGAAPNHHADEEASVFPRLRAVAQGTAEVLLAELEHDHDEISASWRHLRPLLVGIAAGVRANLSPRQVDDLRTLYLSHIGREERLLIPFAVRALDGATLRKIGEEMAARRGARFGPGKAP